MCDRYEASLSILVGHLLCLVSPGPVLVVLGGVPVHGLLQVGNHHQRPDLLHDLDQLLSGGPLVASLQHVSTDFSVGADVGVVDSGLEGDDWSLEGEVGELEFEFEVASDEWAFFGACNVDFPEVVLLDDDHEVPASQHEYSFSSSARSLLSRGADIDGQDMIIKD